MPWFPSCYFTKSTNPTPSSSVNDSSSSSHIPPNISSSPPLNLPSSFYLLLSASTLYFSYSLYKRFIRRIPNVNHIKPYYYRRRSLFGYVTAVRDGDNFHLYHVPGGKLTGWGWLPGRSIPCDASTLKNKTIHIRIAGIDAPELAHFGRPEQPYAAAAKEWLSQYILHKYVRVYIYRRDQYDRVVATVYARKFLVKRDVGLEMLKRGLATLYEAKTGCEFGKSKLLYTSTELKARQARRGLWKQLPRSKSAFSFSTILSLPSSPQSLPSFETPRQYKIRTRSPPHQS